MEKIVAAQVFFYLEMEEGNGTCSYTSADGVTVPFFSSPEEAHSFLKQHQLQGFQVTLINPGQIEDFSEACKRGGASFLQLDPKANTVIGVSFSSLKF